MKITAAIIGSSTGIGRALAEAHQERGIECITFSRKPESLEGFISFHLDLTNEQDAESVFKIAFSRYPDIEKIFLVSGTGDVETTPSYESAKSTIALNCSGFTLAAYHATKHLEYRGGGHLLAVTSVAAIRGGGQSLSYNASKAYQSSLLEGLRCRLTRLKSPITVTEVRAGFVDTSMMKAEKPFWVASPDQAAEAILSASLTRRDLIYVLGRWRLVGWLLTLLPTFIYKRIG